MTRRGRSSVVVVSWALFSTCAPENHDTPTRSVEKECYRGPSCTVPARIGRPSFRPVSMEESVVLREVTAGYTPSGAPELVAVDLAVRAGEIVCLLGPNGAG